MKTDRTRSHIFTRGLEGRSSEKEVMIDTSLYMIGWRAGFQSVIGWGAGPCCVILQEEGFLPMSGLNEFLMPKFQMSTHIAGIQKESLFVITLIGLDGARRV